MFKTIARIIRWCGDFRKKLYIGFFFSFLSGWVAAAPVVYAGWLIAGLFSWNRKGTEIPTGLSRQSFGVILLLVLLRFLFDYIKARFQETISYELIARDRLEIGNALKRVSLGYFQEKDTGTILNSITTGLYTLENMGIRMIDTFVGGYLNFLCIFIMLLFIHPVSALLSLLGVAVSFICLCLISKHSAENTIVQNNANEKLTRSAVEYVRGLAVVKSFGMEGAAFSSFREACKDAKKIALKIEWGFVPYNCMHLLALKIASIAMVISVMLAGITGELELSMVLIFSLLSLMLFASVEPIADSAHILSIINHALDQLNALSKEHYIDENGKEIELTDYNIRFDHVDFSYDKTGEITNVIRDVTLDIKEGTTTAIIGPSGSGKTTLCRLLARFYDVTGGSITIGGHDLKEFTCESLLGNISMVFQDVYLFNDTVRANICFGKEHVSEDDMIAVAKQARCHDFIMALPKGYDTVIGEGGNSLSGGEKQRISIARAILKNAPIIILDESTSSIDPENEHLIQAALSVLTKGKTVIVIAHRLVTIESADQIIVLKGGKMEQIGTHEELSAVEGTYKEYKMLREKAERWTVGNTTSH